MDPNAIPTEAAQDSEDAREPRTTKLREKGESFYLSQKNSFYNKVESACKILKDCFTKSEPLPKSIAALDNTESTLLSAYKRYDSCANDYLDCLAHSRVSASTQ